MNTEQAKPLAKATIQGSTWGGSMLKMGFVGVGMCLEFWTEQYKTLTTSRIEEVKTFQRKA